MRGGWQCRLRGSCWFNTCWFEFADEVSDSLINAEYEYIALHRDVGETELKQVSDLFI